VTDVVMTILVAVYNTEQFLDRCLDSLCGQTLHDIQVVCIDDASTDGSPAILRRYQAADPRIEVVTLTTNRGQAFARNQGLKRARGRYVAYLDSDDWMAPDCLEQALRAFENHPRAGCVLLHTVYWEDETHWREFAMEPFECISGHEAFVRSLTWKIHGVYVVRADIHRRYPYDESAHSFSDDNTTRLHYLASDEVCTCEGTYFYRQHAASVSHRTDLRRFDYLVANRSMSRKLKELGVSRETAAVYENHRWLNVIDLYMIFFRHRHAMSPHDAAQALGRLREAWQSIDVSLLAGSLRRKPGYMPLRGSWFLFRLQEELYFSLRKMLGR